jgi:hypothetical protein
MLLPIKALDMDIYGGRPTWAVIPRITLWVMADNISISFLRWIWSLSSLSEPNRTIPVIPSKLSKITSQLQYWTINRKVKNRLVIDDKDGQNAACFETSGIYASD